MVGQLAVVHHLQQDVEQVRVRLLDLVQQQHAVGMLVDRVGEQPTLVEADITRSGAPIKRLIGVALHVLGHVEADQLHAERGSTKAGFAASVLPTPVGPENR